MTFALALLIGLVVGIVLGLAGGAVLSRSRSGPDPVSDEERLRDLAARVLADSQQRLVELNTAQQEAIASQAAQAAQRQEKSVHDLVDPIDRKLRELDESLKKIEQSRSTDQGALRTAVGNLTELTSSLNRETQILATAMKDNKARGGWGEMQLQRVVELAGMIEHCDFVTQTTVAGEDGRLRPDLVVQLPQSRAIVVDSKVPMSAYWDSINTEDPAARKALLDQHTRDVMSHVNELQKRNYSGYVSGALDFVVMFVPGDAFLDAAFESKASWFEDSIAKGVFPASPGTLVALLRAISYGWRQEQLAENAEEIANLGRQVHERVATLAANFTKVGKALGNATESYNETIGTLEGRLLPATRKMEARGIKSAKELPELKPIEVVPRTLSAPELQVGAADGVGSDQDRLDL